MQVFIKTLTGITITLDCESIDNLKRQISEREGMDIDRQRLNYGGKELDAESLSDGITVHLSSRMMGGDKKSNKQVGDALKKDIALTVLSFIIGIFFVIWPIVAIIVKNLGHNKTIIKELATNMAKSMEETGKTGISWVLEMILILLKFFYIIFVVILVGGGLGGFEYAMNKGSAAKYAVQNIYIPAAKTKFNAATNAAKSAFETGTNATRKAIGTGFGVTASAVGTGTKEFETHVKKNAMNLPIAVGIATGLGVGMYYGLRDLPHTEIAILSPFILAFAFPLIMKYVYKFENWRVEPINILFILGLIIFSIYSTFKNGDEFSRAIVLNSSIILTLSYIAQRYCDKFTDNESCKKVSAIDALKNSLLLTGASAVFLVSVL